MGPKLIEPPTVRPPVADVGRRVAVRLRCDASIRAPAVPIRHLVRTTGAGISEVGQC
ncbi:MAG: hypothetical protein ACRDMX_01215 [Solirubrobacteraceae bacterium]